MKKLLVAVCTLIVLGAIIFGFRGKLFPVQVLEHASDGRVNIYYYGRIEGETDLPAETPSFALIYELVEPFDSDESFGEWWDLLRELSLDRLQGDELYFYFFLVRDNHVVFGQRCSVGELEKPVMETSCVYGRFYIPLPMEYRES